MFVLDKYNYIKITQKLIKDIEKLKNSFVILPNNEIIYNKEMFLETIKLFNIKYIKQEKEYLALINNEYVLKYAYAPTIIKDVFKGLLND